MPDTSQLVKLMVYNSMGQCCLIENLRVAAHYLISPKVTSDYAKEGSECLAFIQGTGLEMMMDDFKLSYNASALRKNFFTLLDRRDLIEP